MSVIGWLLIGAIIGVITGMTAKGSSSGGMVGTVILAMLGSLLGGLVGNLILKNLVSFFTFSSFIIAALSALTVLLLDRTINE